MAKHGDKTSVLKPEEKTRPSVVYKGHAKAMEAKIPKGRVHDPYSYEIETWTQLEPLYPKDKRVIWARVAPLLEHPTDATRTASTKREGGAA